ncbi:MAG: glycosyltransferase family 39 protein [Bacteroidota bacterium]
MNLNDPISKEERIGILLVVLALAASLFANLGVYPLYLEEPRRALITLEMIYSGNWIVPTEFGEFYYKKPPVWNWVQMASFYLFGPNEFGARFFGVVSYLLIGYVIYWFVKRFQSERLAIYSSLFFLTTGSGLIYMNSASGEIDLLYCVITFLMFMTIYYHHEKKKYLQLFVVAYLLTALGALTKGLPSGVFVGFTLFGLFVDKRQFRMLFSYQHILGIALLTLIVGSYAYAYYQFNDFTLFFQSDDESLVEQSAGKTFFMSSLPSIITHLFTFPFSIVFDLLPVSILVIFVFNRELVKRWWKEPFMRYLLITLGVNILIYWLSPMTRTRYMYMLYPIPVIFFVYALLSGTSKWRQQVWHVFALVLQFLLLIGCISLPFLPVEQLTLLDNVVWLSCIFSLAMAGIIYLYFKKKALRLLCVIGSMVVLRFIFDFTASPIRALQSDMLNRKNEGIAIGQLVKPYPVYMYKDSEISRQRIFYIEQQSENFVRLSEQLDSTNYFLVDEKYLAEIENFTSYYETELNHTKLHLIRLAK